MVNISKEVVLIFLVIVLALWVFYPLYDGYEGFDCKGREFVPVGQPRYGLRGEPLLRSCIDKYYIRPDRQIRLSQSNNLMWESDYTPGMEGIKDCRRVSCPTNTNEFDAEDVCWKCGSSCPEKMKIPDIQPHVPN
jgi:hypothetical protein